MWPLYAVQMVRADGLRLPRLQICHHRCHSHLQGREDAKCMFESVWKFALHVAVVNLACVSVSAHLSWQA